MLLTLSTRSEQASDLGFLLHKHPDRVHECVFAVMALESEPVDPRL